MIIGPREDIGEKGTAAGTAFCDVLSFEMEAPPETVRVCDEEGRGGLLELTVYVTAGGEDGGGMLLESMVGGKPYSTLF